MLFYFESIRSSLNKNFKKIFAIKELIFIFHKKKTFFVKSTIEYQTKTRLFFIEKTIPLQPPSFLLDATIS